LLVFGLRTGPGSKAFMDERPRWSWQMSRDGQRVESASAKAELSEIGPTALADTVALWDWRRRVAEIYGRVRTLSPPEGSAFWRAARDALFRSHPQTPLDRARQASFSGLNYFAYDPTLRFVVELVPATRADAIEIEVGRDGVISLTAFARTRGLADKFDGELTLYWIGGYGGGVFLPFRDASNGRETYAAGRYLLDTIKGTDLGCTADGRAILDFNFAYNPSCSYSDQWVCPLAPAENTLRWAVRAGERL
jgi:uncharacterized protein